MELFICTLKRMRWLDKGKIAKHFQIALKYVILLYFETCTVIEDVFRYPYYLQRKLWISLLFAMMHPLFLRRALSPFKFEIKSCPSFHQINLSRRDLSRRDLSRREHKTPNLYEGNAFLLPALFLVAVILSPNDIAASWRRSCSFSRFNPSTSTFLGAPKYRLMYSIALLGLSGSSYNPTRTFVNASRTPAFSRYFLNSSFLEPSDELLWLLLFMLLLLWLPWFDEECDEEWLPAFPPPLLLWPLLVLESFPEFACYQIYRRRNRKNQLLHDISKASPYGVPTHWK